MIQSILQTPVLQASGYSSPASQRITYVALAALSTTAALLALPWELALPFGFCAALLAFSMPTGDGQTQTVVREHVVIEDPVPFYRRFRPLAWLNRPWFAPRRIWNTPMRAPIYHPAAPTPWIAPRAPAPVHRALPVAPPQQAPRAPVNVHRAAPVAPPQQAPRAPAPVHRAPPVAPPQQAPRAPVNVHRAPPVAQPQQAPRVPAPVHRAPPVAPPQQAPRALMNMPRPAAPLPTRAPVGVRHA